MCHSGEVTLYAKCLSAYWGGGLPYVWGPSASGCVGSICFRVTKVFCHSGVHDVLVDRITGRSSKVDPGVTATFSGRGGY
jgi:hypothetical protein